MTRLISALLVLLALANSTHAGTLTFDSYYHNDHLGSPVAATDERGDLLWRAHFRPYGERQENPTDAAFGTVGYTGHMQDDGSGLVYAGARYYDPVVGRFLAIDPVGVDAGRPVSFNRYAYANNSPYGFVDPDGRSPVVAMEIAVVGALVLTGAAIVNSNGWSTAFPAHQGGGEVYGGSSIDSTISGPWHIGRPASGFNWPTWMSSEKNEGKVSASVEPKAGSTDGEGAKKAFSNKIKDQARAESRDTCVFCGTKTTLEPGPSRSEIDHAIPKSRGGNNTLENAQNTCRTCNRSKGPKTTGEFLSQ
ncbi:RHS repeat-associated core domain-containing protein [Phytopseudomonas dryadis]|uniref:HNH nuclease domain-containing protein n=1 Tax=Phytopseudomonas dryadis TaxID=2487520 RepID=A0ABY1YZ45_9GAMM|nr:MULTISPECIES: RHS repeat-associated core domain-containing protein [Pseudomonas]TBU99001.1 hypothetical protein DNK34_24925 [Pseudomonas dryadis]TBV11934.1 hypothetical protein DNK41_24975 [Pseudomonas sp. FRB 230]